MLESAPDRIDEYTQLLINGDFVTTHFSHAEFGE